MKWFKLILPQAKTTSNELSALLNMFVELFTASAELRNTALFSSESSANTFYIRASEHSIPYIGLLTVPYSASVCQKPAEEKLTLLAGRAEHVDKLLQSGKT